MTIRLDLRLWLPGTVDSGEMFWLAEQYFSRPYLKYWIAKFALQLVTSSRISLSVWTNNWKGEVTWDFYEEPGFIIRHFLASSSTRARLKKVGIDPQLLSRKVHRPMSSEFGTHKTVTARFWPWLEPFPGKSLWKIWSWPLLARMRKQQYPGKPGWGRCTRAIYFTNALLLPVQFICVVLFFCCQQAITCDRLRIGWLNGPLCEEFRESRRCSRDTYPESNITKYIRIYEENSYGDWVPGHAWMRSVYTQKLLHKRNCLWATKITTHMNRTSNSIAFV